MVFLIDAKLINIIKLFTREKVMVSDFASK